MMQELNFALVLASTFAFGSAAAATDSPNIVVILTDDQGYADISLNPHHPKEVSTPHMDALAEDGVFFSQGYTSGHVCSPTRAGIMLGGYSQSVGVYTAGDGGRGFDPKKRIFPGYLPDRYVSSAIGKWHLGLDDDYPELKWHAMSRGFDECYKFMGRGGHSYFDLRSDTEGKFTGAIYRNKERINDEGYLTNRLTEEAVDFIDRNKENPFFLYLAYNAVHAPPEAPEEDIKAYQIKFPELSKERAILMAMLKHLDDGVGDVVGKLKDEGIFNNTILFFLTDNGGSKAMSADNTPLRGFKQTLDEGGIRTPFIVSWPDKFKGGRTINTPIISFDILPTVLDASGAIPAKHDFAGKSLLPLLTGETTRHHDTLFWSKGPDDEWAVRRGDWKLHWTKGNMELINLADDISESKNLLKGNADKVKELSEAYDDWIAKMEDPITGGPKRADVADRKTGSEETTASSAGKPMTPREIERAKIRELRRAEKKAAKDKEKAAAKAKQKAAKKSGNDDQASNTVTTQRPNAKIPANSDVGPHPGSLFDLSHWKLTLPTNSSNSYDGHAAEVTSTELVAGFKDPHFRTNSAGSMVFSCPVAGATTEGTKFPRCELREMLKPGDEDTNWTAQGTHTLRATCRITQLPSYPKVVIGQIHSYSGKAKPLVKLQYYKNRIEALVKVSPTSGMDRKLTFADSKLGDEIQYEIKVKDDSLSVTVNGETQTEDLANNDPEWIDQTFYFKAGVYPQDNEGPLSEAACVEFSDLTVIHRS